MNFIADFHIHSRYSRATSQDMNLENLNKWAKIKGINLLGTGDFTHPKWLEDLKEKLEPAETGIFKLKNFNSGVRFILTSEISCVYSKKGKVRKIHIIIFAPSFGIVEKINARLSWIGNLKSDGRPILGLDAKELVKIILNVSEDCLIVPAHLMTPWFSLFGSRSGFNSLEECFEEYSKYIYAGETGLSANPRMIWRIPDGRKITLISNSDSHSPSRIGREANIFEGNKLNYYSIVKAIKTGGNKSVNHFSDDLHLKYTIEFFPEEGKYHYDGHRLCGVSLSPKESKKYNNLCPACGKPLTVGVLNRIEQLADKPDGFQPENAVPFKSLVPLEEIIADVLEVMPGTKKVEAEYKNLVEKFGSEFNVLINIDKEKLENATLPEIVEGIIKAREGKVSVVPGYDGVYGKVKIFSSEEKKSISKQCVLF